MKEKSVKKNCGQPIPPVEEQFFFLSKAIGNSKQQNPQNVILKNDLDSVADFPSFPLIIKKKIVQAEKF